MDQILSVISNHMISSTAINVVKEDLNRNNVESLIFKYGQDSLSYLSLEGEKKYYISESVDGFIAYVVVKNIAVCVGNPVCMHSELLNIINEFRTFCTKRKLKICFCSISEEFAELLKNNGFIISKYGEEALIDLNTYTIAGKKTEKLRQKIRRAEKLEIRTVEYIPNEYRDLILENKINLVTQEWFLHKNGQQLTLTLGDLNFDNPLDRRFFVSLDENDDVMAILMFSPFDNHKGYFLDVMRRKMDSPPGVMEKAIIDVAMKVKDEGARWISLGLAPLAGLDNLNKNSTTLEKLFRLVFNHGNAQYQFQSLYQYKKKFNPSCWNNRYVAHQKGIRSIKMAYIMAKSRNVDKVFIKAAQCILKLVNTKKAVN